MPEGVTSVVPPHPPIQRGSSAQTNFGAAIPKQRNSFLCPRLTEVGTNSVPTPRTEYRPQSLTTNRIGSHCTFRVVQILIRFETEPSRI